jgi:hypothetical protein
VNEHIFTAIVTDDEAESLLAVEEFYDTGAFTDDLGRHAGTAATTAATETAAATAEAITAAAKAIAATTEAVTTAPEAITAAKSSAEAVAAAKSSAEVIVPEAVTLIPATTLPAAPTIETHAVLVFPKSPRIHQDSQLGAARESHSLPGLRGPTSDHIANLALLRVVFHSLGCVFVDD